jgi:hypothetical protein
MLHPLTASPQRVTETRDRPMLRLLGFTIQASHPC